MLDHVLKGKFNNLFRCNLTRPESGKKISNEDTVKPEGDNWRCRNKDLLKRTYLNYALGWQIKPLQNGPSVGSSSKRVNGFLLIVVLSQIFSEGEFSGCCLQGALARWLPAWNLVTVWQEYDLSTFAKFLRALCGQMSESVSQWVSE